MSNDQEEKRGNPWKSLGRGPLIAPSLLACDFARMGEQIDRAVAAGADVLHVDVMDGHFVPNLSMGPPVVKSIRKYTDCPLDVHIMVTDPAYYVERFADAGADSITFHIEATDEAARLVERLGELGLGAGVSLKPGTPAEAIADVAADVDMVLVMAVEPGYGGQRFMENMLEKIATLRGMLTEAQRLEVDGGINPATARLCARRGADVFVAGENIFGSNDIPAAIRELREAANTWNRDKGQGTRNQGQGTRDQEPGTRDKGQGTRNQGQGTRNQGPGTRNQGPGNRE